MGLVVPRHVGSPGPGIEPVSPALAGRLSTTMPLGKPLHWCFKASILLPFSYPLVYHQVREKSMSHADTVLTLLMMRMFGGN